MKRKSMLIINVIILLMFFTTIAVITDSNILKPNLTGFTFAEFYTDEIILIENKISGEEIVFQVPIQNNKKTILKEVYTTIEIFDSNQRKIIRLESEKINVTPKSIEKITSKWQNNVPAGDYTAKIYISSEKSDATFTKQFEIEPRTISIESILIRDFILGEIANPQILIKNHLKEEVTNLKASLIIYNKENNKIAELESNRTTISPNAQETITTTWNTKGLEPGEYNGELTVANKEYSKEKEIIIEIEENKLNVIGTGFAINYSQESTLDLKTILISLITILILTNIVIWIIHKRKN